ncbi:MAG: PA2169 family four-helix-bundle protein, partial [Chitinophagaceae bacterium]|nr:PA2169 family four-helix-bundle protein [Chitinophagaceae bacterium]
MTTTDTTTETLNDLVAIQNDRIEGYERALKELDENSTDLKQLFFSMIDESRRMKMDLGNEIQVDGGTIESGSTAMGKIYRGWMDVKAAFSGHSRKSVLENCEFGEDAAQKAYKSALSEEDIPKHIRLMLSEQKDAL